MAHKRYWLCGRRLIRRYLTKRKNSDMVLNAYKDIGLAVNTGIREAKCYGNFVIVIGWWQIKVMNK